MLFTVVLMLTVCPIRFNFNPGYSNTDVMVYRFSKITVELHAAKINDHDETLRVKVSIQIQTYIS